MSVIVVIFIIYMTCCIINLLCYNYMFADVDKRPDQSSRSLGFIVVCIMVMSGPVMLVKNTVHTLRLRWFWWRNHEKIMKMIMDEMKRQSIELVD
jgi:hypothetical protein